MGTKVYKEHYKTMIKTDAIEEYHFKAEISKIIYEMIINEQFVDYDPEGNPCGGFCIGCFSAFLSDIADIICKYRGYKNDVTEERVFIKGSIPPGDCECFENDCFNNRPTTPGIKQRSDS